ncbi:MAG: hypothetical protein D8M52_06235 [Chlorobi bacterium]|nr:MAG: Amicyanin precursor [Microgenomates bacterium OLB23]MBE2266517.1 hypothetical protein [Flavobacteriales bacterium]MBL1161302.1 hypothetical protein [Chlorobiota bacterium]MBZ0195477.1 hypothetical protein [Candidatus Kapabacteria bacterium]MCC6332000.1 hypothetical protein [Ignavibacteria bacterium]
MSSLQKSVLPFMGTLWLIFMGCTSNNNDNKTTVEQEHVGVTDTVVIEGMQFVPQSLTVHKGDTVVWINRDMVVHNVTDDSNRSQSSGDINVGATWMMVPSKSFSYLCTIHPTMTGSVTVQP